MYSSDGYPIELLSLAKKYTDREVAAKNGGVAGTVSIGTSWSGSGPYTQTVTGSYTVTAKTKVDLQADSIVLSQMAADGTEQIYIENDNGTLIAHAEGHPTTQAMTVPAIFAEVKT